MGNCTIGVGHLLHLGECTPSDHALNWSTDECLRVLRSDASIAVEAVRGGVKVPLTQDQFNALVSFTFNVGSGAFASSTLLARVNNHASAASIRDAFLMWVRAGGIVAQGLVNRRTAEADLFNKRS